MMAKGNFIGKFLMAIIAIAIIWVFTPRPQIGLIYATAPDNAQIALDYKNKVYISPPCIVAGAIEPSVFADIRDAVERVIGDREEFGGTERRFAKLVGAEALTYFELATMGKAHTLRKEDKRWRPDGVCNSLGGGTAGFLDERTLWGWIIGRPSRWTPDGRWRW